ncbi:MAG: DNA-cytosine [Gallionellaceae bacterium]|nr:MAG: DNA-cytosine [Gallionellaceae bacterium]
MKRVADLFAGGGGMSLGFQNAGFEVVCAIEKWQPAVDVYRANFLDHPVLQLDLDDEQEAIVGINNFKPDIIIGGPPCQDFSSAGKRDESQGRASLTVSFANIVVGCRPEYFVMENVARSASSGAFKTALSIFKRAGYGVTMKVLDAAYCGAPQTRKRFFVVGALNKKDGFLDDALASGLASKPLTLREYFGRKIDFTHYYRHPRSYARRAVFSIDEPSPTIRGVNRPVPLGYPGHAGDTAPADSIRSLTTAERALIQTFPKNFKFPGSKTDSEQVIGNAVPVKLAEYVASRLAIHIRDVGESSGKQQFSLFQKRKTYEVERSPSA